MAENIPLSPAQPGGARIVVDELTTLNGASVPTDSTPPTGPVVQRMKIGFGPDAELQDVTDAAPLPVAPDVSLGSGAGDANTQRVTLATNDAAVTALANIDADLGNQANSPAPADGSGNYAIIAALKRVLLNGVSSLSNQAAGNNLLALIDGDIGTPADAAATSDTGAFSLNALAKRALQNWTLLLQRIPALGQALMVASVPVAIASNQSAIPVTMPNMTQTSYSQAGVIAANTDLMTIDCQGLQGVSIHCASMGTGGIITPSWSNDGVTFPGATIVPISGGTPLSTFNAAGMWTTPVLGRFLRLRLTTPTTGGTTTLWVQGIAQAANFPVAGQTVSGNVGVLSLPSTPAGTNTIGNLVRQSGFTDSSTVLASGATFTGTGRTISGGNYTRFAATAFADQAGTLFIDLSVDTGATYRQIASVSVAAGVAQQLSVLTTGVSSTATLYRVRYVNGATLQGAFQINSSFLA